MEEVKTHEILNSDGTGDFGYALFALRNGKKVARKGWNGKGMWIVLSEGYKELPVDSVWNEHNKQVAIDNGGTVTVSPYITMKTADNKIKPGWLASQNDMLAEDWEIIK